MPAGRSEKGSQPVRSTWRYLGERHQGVEGQAERAAAFYLRRRTVARKLLPGTSAGTVRRLTFERCDDGEFHCSVGKTGRIVRTGPSAIPSPHCSRRSPPARIDMEQAFSALPPCREGGDGRTLRPRHGERMSTTLGPAEQSSCTRQSPRGSHVIRARTFLEH